MSHWALPALVGGHESHPGCVQLAVAGRVALPEPAVAVAVAVRLLTLEARRSVGSRRVLSNRLMIRRMIKQGRHFEAEPSKHKI
jgi:hypothetical protein